MIDLSVIIVTYNSAHFIKACLDSLLNQLDIQAEIIVIDNLSQDETVAIVKAFSDVTLIENTENSGFATANNIAASKANGDYLFFMNPDAKLLSQHDLSNLLQTIKSDKTIGMLGTPLIGNSGQNESPPKLCYPDQKHLQKFDDSNLPGKIAWVLGASMVMPHALFTQLGGFSEDYFLYAEEIDLCLRIRNAGYKIGYADNIPLYHFGGASENSTRPYELARKKYRALHIFYQKHYAPSDVLHILKRNYYRAFLRAIFYAPLCFIKKYRNKYFRYCGIYSINRELFRKLDKR